MAEIEYPGWPAPHFVETNGIRMAVYESGPKDQRPPLILCHGFPELAYSWRHQMRDLPKAGFRVIAPDQRGYGLTDAPADVASYDIEHLAGDLIGLLDAKGIEKAVFVGHDWGGIIVWQLPLLHPERCAGVIALNTTYVPRPPADPISIMRRRMGEEMYIVHFQKPREADEVLGRDVAKTMSFFLRKPAEGYVPRADGMRSKRTDDRSIYDFVRQLESYDPSKDARPHVLTDAEMQVFVEAFSRSSFTGPINWYRNFTRNWEKSANLPTQIDLPALMIMAELDAVLPPSAADGMEQWIPNLEKRLVRGSGHWTQQEKPEEVTAHITDWMRKTFPS